MAERRASIDTPFDERADYEIWQGELKGHRPHAWMVLLMSLYDVCVWQNRLDERTWAQESRAASKPSGESEPRSSGAVSASTLAPAFVLPRKADTYLLFGLQKKPANFSIDIDETCLWLVDKQVLRKSLFLEGGSSKGQDKWVACSMLVDRAMQALSRIWPEFEAQADRQLASDGIDLTKRAGSSEQMAQVLEAVRGDAALYQTVASIAPELEAPLRMVGKVEPATMARQLSDAYDRLMQLVALSRVICRPACVSRLLDLLGNRGFAEEVAGDFADADYVSLAGISADFGFEPILDRASSKDSRASRLAAASVVCALAVMSAIGPTRLAELGEGYAGELDSPLGAYFAAIGQMAPEAVPVTGVLRGETLERPRQQDYLTLTQVSYDFYQSPIDARGAFVPVHAPIPLEPSKVYYLGREVREENFASEEERRDFVDDQAQGRAVTIVIRPATKTSIARVHAKVFFDRKAGRWMFYALRNRSMAQNLPARTLVIDPTDRVTDALLIRSGKDRRTVDHTTWDSLERGAVPLRRASVLWMGPKAVETPDGSLWWAPDEICGAVFVVRAE